MEATIKAQMPTIERAQSVTNLMAKVEATKVDIQRQE